MRLTLTNIHFQYNKDQPLLRDVSLDLKEGTATGLIGHNGSGKSTLLKIIGRLESPNDGTYTIDNQEAISIDKFRFYKKLGLMIESPGLYPHLSVADNLTIFALYHQAPSKEITQLLQRVNMSSHAHKLVKKLSTGMKQRLAIAISLLGDPEVILLDEPSNGLDPEGIVQIRNLLMSLKQEGKTLVISSHQLLEIEKLCEDVLILNNGKQLYYGQTQHLSDYRDLEDMYLKLSGNDALES